MDDPRSPEVEAFLTSLKPRQELVRRWALMKLYPACMQNSAWKARTRALIRDLRLKETGLARAMREADKVAAQLRANLGEAAE